MRFKVVVCSRCGRARGVRSDSKRSSCHKCGATIKVREARAYLTTDSEKELAQGVAEVNAQLQQSRRKRKKGRRRKGTKGTCRSKGKGGRRTKAKGRGKRALYKEIILTLSTREGVFSFDEVLKAISKARLVPISKIDETEVAKILDELMDKGLIYEPRNGVYRRI
jgi:hypothetical protein